MTSAPALARRALGCPCSLKHSPPTRTMCPDMLLSLTSEHRSCAAQQSLQSFCRDRVLRFVALWA
eukprot:8989362-Alexandrium_andersonii.AAC.1